MFWLVVDLPLWKMMEWARQLGWWHSIPNCFWKVIQNSTVPVSTNQMIFPLNPIKKKKKNSSHNYPCWIGTMFQLLIFARFLRSVKNQRFQSTSGSAKSREASRSQLLGLLMSSNNSSCGSQGKLPPWAKRAPAMMEFVGATKGDVYHGPGIYIYITYIRYIYILYTYYTYIYIYMYIHVIYIYNYALMVNLDPLRESWQLFAAFFFVAAFSKNFPKSSRTSRTFQV